MSPGFVHPSLFLIFGALLLPFIQGPFRRPYLLLVPVMALVAVVANAVHDATGARLFRLPMTPGRVRQALAKAETTR